MTLELKFKFDKETKGTVRYGEVTATENYAVGTLYIRKAALPTPYPQDLTVTITDQGE